MEKEKYQRFSVSLPEDLRKEFDNVCEKIGMSRSDAIRKAMRDYIGEYRLAHEDKSLSSGSITIILNHDERSGLMDDITDLEHDYHEIIQSTLHVHLDHDNCLIVHAVKGPISEIEKLFQEFLKRPEIKLVKKNIMITE
ncbi:MAG: nickel-responsive transcriptional regulator NikR [Candidatus Helarchaeota archaeon]